MILKCVDGPMDGAVYALSRETSDPPGITAAMLRDGRAKGFIEAFKTILRWCDRSGEEPEGQCLHEIEQICRKQLGLELLKVSAMRSMAQND